MKIYFSKVIFSEESQATFDGPDEWIKEWILSYSDVSVVKRRRQGGSSTMIWARIVLPNIEPFKVDEGIKLKNANYCDFKNKTFLAQSQSCSFKVKCLVRHNNAPSHVSKLAMNSF